MFHIQIQDLKFLLPLEAFVWTFHVRDEGSCELPTCTMTSFVISTEEVNVKRSDESLYN